MHISSASREGWHRGDPRACTQVSPRDARPYRLVLLGPPGVGKGTQASLLAAQFQACHLSTGELFRSACHAECPSPAMQTALTAMRSGGLVSDEVVIEMIRERRNCLRCQGGFLLDGVPRTLPQAHALEELLCDIQTPLDAVIAYEMPLEAIVARLSGRRTCSGCGAVFHIANSPPQQKGICDACGAKLLRREDDCPQAIRVRMETYQEATEPLHQFYADRNLLVSVAAGGAPSEILAATLTGLGQRIASDQSARV